MSAERHMLTVDQINYRSRFKTAIATINDEIHQVTQLFAHSLRLGHGRILIR